MKGKGRLAAGAVNREVFFFEEEALFFLEEAGACLWGVFLVESVSPEWFFRAVDLRTRYLRDWEKLITPLLIFSEVCKEKQEEKGSRCYEDQEPDALKIKS